MNTIPYYSNHRQRGAVLIVGLIMLSVMTLFVISMLKTSIIELKIGGASHVVAINFSNAELAINTYINANNLRFAPGFVGTAAETPFSGSSLHGGTATVTTTELQCSQEPGSKDAIGEGFKAVQYDIRATSTGTLGGTAVMHQGVQSLASPTAC